MTYLGKRVDGKYTRKSLAAEKVNEALVQVEMRRKDLGSANAELAKLSAEHESLSVLIRDHDRTLVQMKRSGAEAVEDLRRQNPTADTSSITRDCVAMMEDFEKEFRRALVRIEEVKQAITVKKSSARRSEDRITTYRKQIFALLAESETKAA